MTVVSCIQAWFQIKWYGISCDTNSWVSEKIAPKGNTRVTSSNDTCWINEYLNTMNSRKGHLGNQTSNPQHGA